MNILNLVCILFMINCTDLPLPSPPSHLQKITSMAKNVYMEAVTYSKCYLEFLQDKLGKAKDFICEKVRNLSKRGEPVFVGEEGQEAMPEFSEAELKELFEKLFKDMNLGDATANEGKTSKEESVEENKEENEEKPL